jgi:hypothetical protein
MVRPLPGFQLQPKNMPCPAFNSAGFEIKRSSEDTEKEDTEE